MCYRLRERHFTWTGCSRRRSFETRRRGKKGLYLSHNGKPCPRYHEPRPSDRTAFGQTIIEFEAEDNSAGSSSEISIACCTIRVAYYHSWDEGGLLVSDNILKMHTRTDFVAGCDRELPSIHLD
ncbi:uncharacterized protein PgNI_00163 [Pyricularia grisea]|uniref:TauD/TfdA-like domain-containing protein n=1 Tax=Pyricularia grisea TaxID=148305 RepID=A0A6P8BJN1_PYRGI|nr:uncharacterized protein PgNI_00163 [Pyricularia grisea]TLD16782.1 hypothetical protein PgNI_00163 [Pyricularia grisea]